MRILFLLLLAANLVFFAWMRFMAPPDPALDPQPMAQQLDPGKLRIVTDAELAQITAAPPPAAPGVAPGKPAAPPPPEPAPAPAKPAPPPEPAPFACVEWGGFSLQDAPRAEQRLEPLALGPRLAQFRGEEAAAWWVFIPPQPNRAAAQKKAAELKKLGVEDYFVVQEEGKLRWALSLGVFRTEEAARARFEALRARGVRSGQVGRRETRVARVWFQVRSVDAALNARLQEIARDFEGATLHECVGR
jgi:hypothetical protein